MLKLITPSKMRGLILENKIFIEWIDLIINPLWSDFDFRLWGQGLFKLKKKKNNAGKKDIIHENLCRKKMDSLRFLNDKRVLFSFLMKIESNLMMTKTWIFDLDLTKFFVGKLWFKPKFEIFSSLKSITFIEKWCLSLFEFTGLFAYVFLCLEPNLKGFESINWAFKFENNRLNSEVQRATFEAINFSLKF